jgi:hypothetical protein
LAILRSWNQQLEQALDGLARSSVVTVDGCEQVVAIVIRIIGPRLLKMMLT